MRESIADWKECVDGDEMEAAAMAAVGQQRVEHPPLLFSLEL